MNQIPINTKELKQSSKIDLKKQEAKKKTSLPLFQLSRGRYSKIIIKLTLGLMSFLFGFNPELVRRFIYKQQEFRDKNGIQFYIKYIKQARLHVTRYICGVPLKSNTVGVSLDKSGFPTQFLYLKNLIDSGDPIKIRGVLTLLYMSRVLLPTEEESKRILPNFESITMEFKGREKFSIPTEFIEQFVLKYNLKKEVPQWSKSNHYISGKGSPHGKATKSAGLALWIMSNLQSCKIQLTNFTNLLGIESYMDLIGSNLIRIWRNPGIVIGLGNLCTTNSELGIGHIGKLSIVKDPELKLRVIAMLDYYSQFILRPIHDDLLDLLKKFKCDRTFTQDPRHDWKPKGNKFWSLDLSSATDRFPIDLQERLLSCIYNKDLSATWKSLLTDRNFVYDEEEDNFGGLYRYKVGQPMGAYSSWAAFTLSHHLVIHYAAHLCGINDFDSYIVLGDDVVINNDKVAKKYIRIMTKLGVEISMQKTHVSYNTYEFAKRWFKSKIEISPLPLKGILHNFDNLPVVLLQLMQYLKRCNTLWKGNSLQLISSIYHNIRINNRVWKYHKVYRYLEIWFLLFRYSFGTLSNWEIRRFLIVSKVPTFLLDFREELSPLVIKEFLNYGLTSIAERSSRGVKDMTDHLLVYWRQHVNKSEHIKDPDFELSEFQEMPIIYGLINRLDQIDETLTKLINAPSFDLIEAMNSMRIESVDRIVSEKRDIVETVNNLRNLWTSSLRKIKKITEDNYYEHINYQDVLELAMAHRVPNEFGSMIKKDPYPLRSFIKAITPTRLRLVNLSKGYFFETYQEPT